MMLNAVLSPPNAILFVFDPTNRGVTIPEYADGKLAAATDTCVSVGTLPEADGETEVSLATESPIAKGLKQVYCGKITTPGGKIAVVTSQLQRILELDVPIGSVTLTVLADDERIPSKVAIFVSPREGPVKGTAP
ncbi:MAG: hypothetical protein R3D56_05915 [Paracoccaceae bacterium]